MTETDAPRKSGIVTKILVGFGVLIVAIALYAAMKPNTFQVQRAIRIAASPERVFPLINDLNAWRTWSPYEKRDPAMQRTFGAVTVGTGAMYGWDGNDNVGKGSMEIVESTPPSRVAIKLDFERPFEAHNHVDFILEPAGDMTNVTWAMGGPQPYFSKLLGIFLNMDKMIGRDFEAGLADLKTLAETPEPTPPAPMQDDSAGQ